MAAKPLLLSPEKCIGDALVNKGVEAPKPHFPTVEVRMPSPATGDLILASTASTMMRDIFYPPPLSWSLGEEAKKRIGRTNVNQFTPPFWRKAVEKKSTQTLVFDPDGVEQIVNASAHFWEGGAHASWGIRLIRCDGI